MQQNVQKTHHRVVIQDLIKDFTMILHRLPLDEWFDDIPHPHDDMPIATNDRFDMYGSSDADDAYKPQHLEEEVAEDLNMHEKMYEIATAKYNPFAVGGSESIHDFPGGSENVK